MLNIEKLTASFKESLLWANEIDDNTIHNISDHTNQQIDIIIGDFLLLLNNEEMKECEEDVEQFGHWLALSCGHHGAGFFDSDCETIRNIDNKLNKLPHYEQAYQEDGIIFCDFY